MVDRVESDGWLIITSGSDTVKLYCEGVGWKPFIKGKYKHIKGGVNILIPVYQSWIEVYAHDIWINSNAKIDNYQYYLRLWLASGVFTVQLTYDGTNYEKMDGTNTSLSMGVKADLGTIENVAKGGQEVYYIDQLILEEG